VLVVTGQLGQQIRPHLLLQRGLGRSQGVAVRLQAGQRSLLNTSLVKRLQSKQIINEKTTPGTETDSVDPGVCYLLEQSSICC